MKEKEALQAALLKRAIGYDYEEKKIIADKNGKPQKIEVYHKHVPPDIRKNMPKQGHTVC